MDPWIAKALVLTGTVMMIAIRAPHGHRSRIVKVATSYKTPLETGLLVLAWVGFFVPLIWVASPAFSFAEYALCTGPLVVGGAGALGPRRRFVDRPPRLGPCAGAGQQHHQTESTAPLHGFLRRELWGARRPRHGVRRDPGHDGDGAPAGPRRWRPAPAAPARG